MLIYKCQRYFFVLIFLIATSCTKKSDAVAYGDFHIKVKVADLVDGTKVMLKKQENNATILIDSTITYKGEFDFKGTIEAPAMFGIFIDSIRGGIFPLVESGTIMITVHKDSLHAPSITGSELNDELQKFKEGSQIIVSKISKLFIQIQKARAENNLDKIKEINTKMRAINDENTRYSLEYAKNNPNSFVSSIILQSILRIPEIDVNEVRNIYSSFSEDVKKSEYSKIIVAFLESNTGQNETIK